MLNQLQMKLIIIYGSEACGNSPALKLYQSAGFEVFGQPKPLRVGSRLKVQPMTKMLTITIHKVSKGTR